MNTQNKFRNVSVTVTGVGVVDTLRCQPATSRRWAVDVRVFTHARVDDNVDVYRSGLIGASLLTTSPQQRCLVPWPWRACTYGWLGMVTGILLIEISTGGFLVDIKRSYVTMSFTGCRLVMVIVALACVCVCVCVCVWKLYWKKERRKKERNRMKI